MAINPNIALAVKGIELQDPLAQYGKIATIQNAQQQNALAQLQMQEKQLEQEQTNALNRAYAEAYNPSTGEVDANKLRQSLATGGFGSKLPEVEKKISELKTQQLAQQKAKTELVDAKLKQSRAFLENINPMDPNAPAQYIAWHEANHKDPVLGEMLASRGITAEQSRARIEQAIAQGPAAFAELLNQSKLGTEKFMEMNKPQVSNVDVGGQVVSQTVEPLTGRVTTVGTQQKTMAPGEAERIKNEGRRIGLEGRRVAVLEENARREADPVFQQRMAGARAVGEAVAKGDVAAQQALPKVIARAEESMNLIDQMIGKRDSKTGKLLPNEKTHPGFQSAVGATWLPGLRFVPGSDAADFMARFDQIKGASFLEAFESLKGGGAITEKEGQKGTDAINRMSTSQSEAEFVRAAMDLQDVIRKGVANAQTRAKKSGTPAVTGNIDALLEKYK